jgi:hypothetical protein
MTEDYAKYFSPRQDLQSLTADLREEVKAREETREWELRTCPCCGARARVLPLANGAKIACGKGCKIVEGTSMANAVEIWNERRFTEVKA